MFDDDGFDALDAGLLYAGYRHGQDVQTRALLAGQQRLAAAASGPTEVTVEVNFPEPEKERHAPINALDFTTADIPDDWSGYIGQDPMKRQLEVYLASAKARNQRLPHTLLASGFPGVGKTTMARLLAKMMGVDIYEMVPPFHLDALVEAASSLKDRDVLFIDEIHKLADAGKRGTEFLLKLLEDGVVFMPDGEVIELPDITVIGATTDRDKLPEPVIDRFKVKPYLQPYSLPELGRIVIEFANRHRSLDVIDDYLALAMAKASRGVPRIIEEYVEAARDLSIVRKHNPTPAELLEFVEVEPDGLTRTHIQYLTTVRQFFPRTKRDTEEIEYIVGEPAIMQILRETKPGIGRIEAFLVERGLIDRTPRGRRLTDAGIDRAEEFIAQGKGAVAA